MGNREIEIESKEYKSFIWSLGICEKFSGEYDPCLQDKVSLCQYVRIRFIYVPLIFLSQIILWLAVFLVAVFAPISLWGFATCGKIILIASGIAAVAAIVFVGVFCLNEILENWQNNRKKKFSLSEDPDDQTPHIIGGRPGLFMEWFLSQKNKVCPEIKFVLREEKKQ